VRDQTVLKKVKAIKKKYEKEIVEASGEGMDWNEFLKDVETGLNLREPCQ
jgi:hypothetical protein